MLIFLYKKKLANEATGELINVIKNSLDKHAPLIQILPKEKRDYIPWYTDELRAKIKIKKELLKDSRMLGKNLFEDRLKKLSNNFLMVCCKTKFG